MWAVELLHALSGWSRKSAPREYVAFMFSGFQTEKTAIPANTGQQIMPLARPALCKV